MEQLKTRSIKYWLERILFVMLLAFPFGTALVLAVGKVFKDPEMRLYDAIIFGQLTPSGMQTVLIGLVVFIALMAFLYFKLPKGLFVMVIIGCIIRISLILMVYNNIFFGGDTLSVYEVSQGVAAPKHALYWSFLPEWSNWATFQKFMGVLGFNQQSLLLFQGIMDCVIVFEIRALFMLVTKNRPASNIAACIYAFMPSQILYTLTFLPDMTAMAFMLGGFIVALRVIMNSQVNLKRDIIQSIVGGTLVGIGASFKPIGLVLCIALALYCLIKVLNKDYQRRDALIRIVCAVLVFALAVAVPRVAHVITEDQLGRPISNSAAPHYLNVGLNTETNGVFNTTGLAFTYIQSRLDGATEEEGIQKATEAITRAWKANPEKVPALFAAKIMNEWQYEGDPACFARNTLNENVQGPGAQLVKPFNEYAAPACHLYYIMLMLFSCLGAVLVIIKSRRWSDMLLAVGLVIMGIALLLLLSEAQSRYKSNTYPYISIICTLGIVGTFELVRSLCTSTAGALRRKRIRTFEGEGDLDPQVKKSAEPAAGIAKVPVIGTFIAQVRARRAAQTDGFKGEDQADQEEKDTSGASDGDSGAGGQAGEGDREHDASEINGDEVADMSGENARVARKRRRARKAAAVEAATLKAASLRGRIVGLDALSRQMQSAFQEKQQASEAERQERITFDTAQLNALRDAVEGERRRMSIVVPCFNEARNVEPMAKALLGLFDTTLAGYDPEIIFIDNHSNDGTRERLRRICAEHPQVRAIFNARNVGIFNSLYYGLCQATGDAAVLIFCDFQEPVELVPVFVNSWEEGYKVVCAIKTKSLENPIMRFLRTCYYKFIKRFSVVDQIEHFTGAGLYDRSFLDVMRAIDDPTPFLKGIVAELGFKRLDIEYTQKRRRTGKTHSNFAALYDYAMLTFTTYTKVGLRAATFIGGALAIVGLIWVVALAITALSGTTVFDSRWIMAFVVLFGSACLFFIGILGEYVMSINTRLMKRPLVVEEERLNF